MKHTLDSQSTPFICDNHSTQQKFKHVRIEGVCFIHGHGALSAKIKFCCAWPGDPSVVIEQYALLFSMRAHPSCAACVLSPLSQRKRPCKQPPSHPSAEWAQALFHLYMKIYYTQKNPGDGKCAFLLTVKNCGGWGWGGDCVMYWNLHLNEEKAQAPNRWLVLESL